MNIDKSSHHVLKVKEAFFVRCSCDMLLDTPEDQIMHYAIAHHNLDPLLQYHQAELADLRKELQIARSGQNDG